MHPGEDEDYLDAGLARAAGLLCRADRVAVLTGAGVSAESGLATFRGGGGLWEGHRVEDVATPGAFARDPLLVWRFYHARRSALRSAQPNPGHLALAQMEDRWGSEHFTLITQNVDGLHRAAGSRHVLEVHGSLARVRCSGCGKVEDRGTEELPELPRCDCGALLRPDVVWFGEYLPPDVWREAVAAVANCQCFLVIGTSAVVYPAAGLIDYARMAGASVIEINLEPTGAALDSSVALYGPSGAILPQLVRRL